MTAQRAPISDQPADPAHKRHPLLTELVYNSLDPGYAQAAARRGSAPAKRRWDGVALAVGCLLAGFILVVAYVHAHRTAPQVQRVHNDLVTRVQNAQADERALGQRVNRLQLRLATVRQHALPESGALMQRLNALELAAGQLAVHGPGVTVTLREPPAQSSAPAPARAGTVPETSTNILTDRDVRSVVNELWHDGAEAIAVNGIRLTPTSAIRFAGQAILVDFQSITSPYTISAIGNSEQLITSFAQSDVASRYKTLAGVDGIGFTFATSADLALPAGTVGSVRYAHPLATGTGPR
jgi:uncharacterized protein YlxW (UPF0749 family)